MSKHSTPPRGLDATRSPLFQGRFGRLFRNLAPAEFGATPQEVESNLAELAGKMLGEDTVKNGPDGEESGIPALYTYFGQFVDHDITFDPMSQLAKFRDPDGLTDFRTPALDLDNVYGRGPDDQPYMYRTDQGVARFVVGEPINGGGGPAASDLPRFNGRALIGDPRNDENVIVSQLQGLFHRFHNRMADDNPGYDFQQVQQRVRFHYQYIVLNDFLPRLITADVLNGLQSNGRYEQDRLKFFHWKNEPFMPVEFSVAAYRLGHSMVRPGYRLNDTEQTLLPIFPTPDLPEGLTGFRSMNSAWAIDWARFIDLEIRGNGQEDNEGNPDNGRRLQFAYRIDTSVVGPLGNLPMPQVVGDPPPSLILRNLLRGWRLGLPSGQSVARAMGLPVIADRDLLIGRALDNPTPDEQPIPISDLGGGVFDDNCPLWVYILAEAMLHRKGVLIPTGEGLTVTTPQLGPVGGRIVAEVFLGMLFGDNASLLALDPLWTPNGGPDFTLKDFVRYALGQGPALG